MRGLIEWIRAVAVSMGGPGLFIIAFLDSSFLSFPEVSDILIVFLTVQHPERMAYYAAMTTAVSIGGCLVLYGLARKGGEAFLRRRLNPEYLERAMATFRRYGLLAILVPSILPPPMPLIHGSSVPSAKVVAITASTQSPPSASTAARNRSTSISPIRPYFIRHSAYVS